MPFKTCPSQFQLADLSVIDPDPRHARQNINEDALKGLVNAIRKLGVIHPLIVRPGAAGRYTVIAGERRRLAAILAGEATVPVVVRDCSPEDCLEVQVFENIGLGVRSALEPRDMANAIQSIADRFESAEEAAQYFGRAPTWLSQATAAANLSEKVTALLDSGKIASTGAAVQLEKLVRKNEAKADSLIDRIEQLPEGEKVSKKVVDTALSEESGRVKKAEAPAPDPVDAEPQAIPAREAVADHSAQPREEVPEVPVDRPAATPRSEAPGGRINPGKVKLVAELLGVSDEDEEEWLARLIDEFLVLKRGERS